MRPPLRLYHFVGLIALALALALDHAARAHAIGISQSDFALDETDGTTVRAALVFARAEGDALLAGHTEDAEVRALVDRGVEVRTDDAPCALGAATAGPAEGDGLRIDATFACDHAPRDLTVTLYLLSELRSSHRHLLRLSAGAASSQVTLHDAERQASLHIGAETPRAPPMVRLGIEHIALGWDHLLFLLALVLAAPRARALVALVTAFTVAHSIALALASFGVVVFPARVVEPLIGASIAFVGFDNLRRAPSLPRAGTTFAFGLIHGLGFASALHALAIPRARLLPALFGFNVGVEIGQLAFVLAVWPIARWLHARPAIGARIARGLSITIGVIGAALAISRALA